MQKQSASSIGGVIPRGTRLFTCRALAAAVAAVTASACGGAMRPAPETVPREHSAAEYDDAVVSGRVVFGDSAAIARARADSGRYPYTAADVHFMSGMIPHHSQAIYMARLAATRGASAAVRTLSGRIVNAQQDEIVVMQQWLADRLKPVPEARPDGLKTAHGSGEHVMLMPGMLAEDQLRQLENARESEFDRLFLTFMIQHHRGAVEMVKQLFDTPGAGQDETVFKVASDINVDQITEIDRMQRMLADVLFNPRN